MPLIATRGAASAQGFGEFAQTAAPIYVEDVFNTYVYTGNGTSQTITNGIDLSTKGGLVWIKNRGAAVLHQWWTTTFGGSNYLRSNGTDGLFDAGATITYNNNGFSLSSSSSGNNQASTPYVAWTFRKQPKFFDVVTWTGDGTTTKEVAHNLQSRPGLIIMKRTDAASDWCIAIRLSDGSYSWGSSGIGSTFALNTTTTPNVGGDALTTITSTYFRPGSLANRVSQINVSGGAYVAYLFAHNAGGFGLSGTDSVISCGSYTVPADANNAPFQDLGWEPQWLITKSVSSSQSWELFDNMRGLRTTGGPTAVLFPNTTAAEATGGTTYPTISSTGFKGIGSASTDYIYIAIRRGPMKTPTSATTVFTPVVRTGTNGATNYTGLSFTPDLVIGKARQNTYSPAPTWTARLYGTNVQVGSSSSNANTAASDAITAWLNNGYSLGGDNSLGNYNLSVTPSNYVSWNFGRAPKFYDTVSYTGTGSARTIPHGLTIAPELMIVKSIDSIRSWMVYNVFDGGTKYAALESTTGWAALSTIWNNTDPTSSVFSVGTNATTNENGIPFIAHLFGSVAGVSKIGTYNGTGTTQQIDCGFTAGARFVLIKRRNSSGDWYVWDSARGIVAGNDPYILYNSTAVEVTSTDYIDTYSAGFEISSTAPAAINAVGGTYLYLAIA